MVMTFHLKILNCNFEIHENQQSNKAYNYWYFLQASKNVLEKAYGTMPAALALGLHILHAFFWRMLV